VRRFVLTGHTGPVYDAAYSADGTRIVTASKDQTGRV
jgi:WD40 repeat protein